MATNPTNYEIDVADVEYVRHGDKPLLARMFKPRGQGPFPAVVELHGGAWCLGDRLMDKPIHEPLAKSGVVVASLDFRVPPDASFTEKIVNLLEQSVVPMQSKNSLIPRLNADKIEMLSSSLVDGLGH